MSTFTLADVTPERVRAAFFDAPMANIKKYLPVVLAALERAGLDDRVMVMMALASIRAETAGFEPISEGKSKYNTSPGGHPFNLYDKRADLGHSMHGHGALYKGRGFIQLTGLVNYAKYGPRVGVADLVATPERANEPDIAAALLVAFLYDRQKRIREAVAAKNWLTARRLVNGGSHGLKQFTEAFKALDGALPR